MSSRLTYKGPVRNPLRRAVVSGLGGGDVIVPGAIAHFNETSIVGSPAVTAWANIGTGGPAYDLDVVNGTAANLTRTTVNGLVAVNAGGTVSIETTAGQLINTPLTIFMVASVNVLSATPHFFTAARSQGVANSQEIFISALDEFGFDAGVTRIVGAADTALHLHTVLNRGNPSSTYEVSGLANTVLGNQGDEDWDWGTLFANAAGIGTINGTIAELIIYPSVLNGGQVATNKAALLDKWAYVTA